MEVTQSWVILVQVFSHFLPNTKHPVATTGSTIRPFCPLLFPNIENLKIHFRKLSFPNVTDEITPETWNQTSQSNPISIDHQQNNPKYIRHSINMNLYRKRALRIPKTKRPRYFQHVGQLLGRIKKTNTGVYTIWICIFCQTHDMRPESIRCRLEAAHCEATPGPVTFPYCGKRCTRMGNPKQHLSLSPSKNAPSLIIKSPRQLGKIL